MVLLAASYELSDPSMTFHEAFLPFDLILQAYLCVASVFCTEYGSG